jgi:hypothetical protein
MFAQGGPMNTAKNFNGDSLRRGRDSSRVPAEYEPGALQLSQCKMQWYRLGTAEVTGAILCLTWYMIDKLCKHSAMFALDVLFAHRDRRVNK